MWWVTAIPLPPFVPSAATMRGQVSKNFPAKYRVAHDRRKQVRPIRYADVADAIAKAENEPSRRAAAHMLAGYYALGPGEITRARMRLLKAALVRQLTADSPLPTNEHA